MSVPIHRINVLSYCNDLFNVENDVSLKFGQKYPEMFLAKFYLSIIPVIFHILPIQFKYGKYEENRRNLMI